jgi:ABC-type lipoprotein export system ATPase subunit
MVTHDAHAASLADRTIRLRDGLIDVDATEERAAS